MFLIRIMMGMMRFIICSIALIRLIKVIMKNLKNYLPLKNKENCTANTKNYFL